MAQTRKLPYTTIGSAVPCPGGWLVMPGRLLGATVLAEEPIVIKDFRDVLDYKPAFTALIVGAPIAFPDRPRPAGHRTAELEAAAKLAWPRRLAIDPIPSIPALRAKTFEEAQAIEPWLTRLAYRRFRAYRDVEASIELYHLRRVFSAQPELAFQMLNGDEPLGTSRHTVAGQRQRLALVEDRIPGITMIANDVRLRGVGFRHLVDAAVLLWSARRVSGRVLSRVPVDPEWNDMGLRMEFVR
ncbi:MAG: DUF429 domain-containing protein [Ilumatobacteraceae bacterium]